MADLEGWVAEHIMGFERGHCQGMCGGASTGSDGTSETWLYCDWCGGLIENGVTKPCPKYPFPKFTLVDLMEKLGENNIPITVRFDILRKTNRFTVIGPEGRIADTDDPFKALCLWCFDRFGEEQAQKESALHLLYLIRDAKLQADMIYLTEANKKYLKTLLITRLNQAIDIVAALRAAEEG